MPRTAYPIGPRSRSLAEACKKLGWALPASSWESPGSKALEVRYAEIVVAIEQSDVVVADLDGYEPNVVFAVGWAAAQAKTVLGYAPGATPLPTTLDAGCYRVTSIADLEETLRALDPNRPASAAWGKTKGDR